MSKMSVVGNIGEPLSTVSVFILEYSGTPEHQTSRILPVGQIGELAVGGHQLAQGYLNRPEQTKTAFIELPGHGQVYRTGDRARLLPDGRLECLGRISSTQVKLRGQRIELGEIEATAYKLDGVDLACAAVIDGALVIFCSSSNTVLAENVTSVCQRWLPGFMRPNDVVIVKDMPRLPSGKVDRKALEKDYKRQSSRLRNDFQNDLEKRLASVIASQLGVELSRDDRLSTNGLDSLRAIIVSSRLRAEGFHVSAARLLEVPSIKELAALLRTNGVQTGPSNHDAFFEFKKKLEAEVENQLPSISEIEEVDSCTPMQNAMLSETMLNSQLNCNWFEIRIPQGGDPNHLQGAIQMIASKNDILRSGFVFIEKLSTFARVVRKQLSASQFSFVESFDYQRNEKEGFSLLTPLTCQLQEGGEKALFHAHHAIFDGWSLDQLVIDLERAMSGQDLVVRPSYSNVSQFYAEYTNSKEHVQAQDYWRSMLENGQPCRLPSLCPKRPAETGISRFQAMSQVKLSQIDRLAMTLGTSRPSIVTAAYSLLLSLYVGSVNPMFGLVSSGRTIPIPGIERVLGPCLTTLPISINLSQLRTFHDLVVQCHRMNRESLVHEYLPLSEIKRLAGLSAGELFDSIFVWQESPASHIVNDQGIAVVDAQDSLNFALTLEAEPRYEDLCFKLTFKTSILPVAQVEKFFKQLDVLLGMLVQGKDQPLSSVTDVFMKHETLVSATNLSYSSLSEETPDIVTTLEKTAAERPQQIALEVVSDFDPTIKSLTIKRLSYHELHRQANCLASTLQSRECGLDDLIVLWMDKSIELYVSILAVLKCGSAFLPLDPSVPLKRAQRIVEEAQAKLVLTRSTFDGAHDLPSSVDVLDVNTTLQEEPCQPFKKIEVKGSNLAYGIFTSGTTGTPKGLVVTHANLTSNIETLTDSYPTDVDDRLLQACSLAFDVAVFEILFTWHRGICLVSAGNDVLFRNIEAFIDCTRVTHLSLTPSVAGLIKRSQVPRVKLLIVAGEALDARVLEDWADGQCLYQGYGPAEATNICTLHPLMDRMDIPTNIGHPLRNTSAFILEDPKGV